MNRPPKKFNCLMSFSQEDPMYRNASVTFEDQPGPDYIENYAKEYMNAMSQMVYVGEVIGSGAYGKVLEASANWSSHVVKVSHLTDLDRQETVENETKILKHLTPSQFTPKFICYTVLGDFAYIEMARVGQSLAELIANNPEPFDLEYTATLASQLMDGVSYLHKKRIYHLDLKCSNICLDIADPTKIRIIDFRGGRFHPGDGVREADLDSGSPEALLGLPKERGSDVWSCGVVIARMFTSFRLFPTDEQEMFSVFFRFGLLPKTAQNAPKYKQLATGLSHVKTEGETKEKISRKIWAMRHRFDTPAVSILSDSEEEFAGLIGKMLDPELANRPKAHVAGANFRVFKYDHFPDTLPPPVPPIEVIDLE